MSKASTPKKAKKKGGKRPGAGRPPLPEDQARNRRVAIRFTEDEYAEVAKRASGQTISDWLRGRALA